MKTTKMPDFRIRNIPELDLRIIRALASLSGQSVNDYLLDVLKEHAEKNRGKFSLEVFKDQG